MTRRVLKQNGEIVPRRTMRSLTPEELSRDSEILKRSNFTEAIKLKYGDSLSLPKRRRRVKFKEDEDDKYFDLPFDEVAPLIPEADIVDSEGKPLNESSLADQLINAEVLLPQGEDLRMAKVIKRNIGPDGTLIGTPHENSMLNTALYDVQFPDGSVKPYLANIIAENILNNVDADGYH